MEIREASEKDIPEILAVLRASLGETSSQKTEAVWRFKHLENPFGKSLVLLAVEGKEIVGVRAFMRWKWQKGKREFSAIRAVDTATRPDHQGKGIFKKLTLSALEFSKKDGDDFVFNTPNSQSKPGYLKMGWREVGKINTVIYPINPINWATKKKFEFSVEGAKTKNLKPNIELYNNGFMKSDLLFTPKSLEYLEWRYEKNPIQDYKVIVTDQFYLSVYVKKHSVLKELRVSEFIAIGEGAKKAAINKLKALAKESEVHFIGISPNAGLRSFFQISGKFGPTLTLRQINLEDNLINKFIDIDIWSNSLGDLELF